METVQAQLKPKVYCLFLHYCHENVRDDHHVNLNLNLVCQSNLNYPNRHHDHCCVDHYYREILLHLLHNKRGLQRLLL